MDLIDSLRLLSARVPNLLDHLQTEEATKNALVMPFINALGYNVFDPTEVVPEFTADVGTKKGEKVDYAIMRGGKPIILIECKWSGADLDKEHASQLFRYFTTSEARVGVLTNGVRYRFYSDLDHPNKMDERPFLEIDMLDLREGLVHELKRFSKSGFDLTQLIDAAIELKYTGAIKRILHSEFAEPSDDFVRLFTYRVYSGKVTQSVREQFSGIVKRAAQQFLKERLNERLKSAITPDEAPAEESVEEPSSRPDGIETTDEEVEGYHIVRAIVGADIDPGRVVMRDTKSYCSVLLDDNNRKPICRLRFNHSKKYIGLFDSEKNEERVAIEGLADIYQYADRLKATVTFYQLA